MDERNIKLKTIWEDFVKEIEEGGKPIYFQTREGTHIEGSGVGGITSGTHWSVVMMGPRGCYNLLTGNVETEFREEAEKYSEEKFNAFKESIGEVYYGTPMVVLNATREAYKTGFFTRITMNQLIKRLEETKVDDYITDTVKTISDMTIKAFPYSEIDEGKLLGMDSTVNPRDINEKSFYGTLWNMHRQLADLGFKFMEKYCFLCNYYTEGGFESGKI